MPNSTRHRAPLGALLYLCLAGCGAASKHPASPAQLGPAPGEKRAQAPRHIDSTEEADSARQDLDYLGEDDRARGPLRGELLRFYTEQATGAIDRGHPEEAYESFTSALTLYTARELQDPDHPPQAPGVLPVAQRLDQAFRRRGSHLEVIAALMVQQTLAPRDPGPRRRYEELASWLAGAPGRPLPWREQKQAGLVVADAPAALVRDLEQAARVWPSPPVVRELSALYLLESQSLGIGPGQRSLRDLMSLGPGRTPQVGPPSLKLARLYLRIGQPQKGLLQIQKLGRSGRAELPAQSDQALVAALEKAFAPDAPPVEPVKLALALAQNPEDIEVSLAICRDLSRKAPQQTPAHLCVGELAGHLQRTGLAIRAFEKARALSPGDRAIWERLAQLYQVRLSDLVGDERTAELEGALTQIEAFHAQMHKQFPGEASGANMSGPLSEVGRGYYNAGRIEDGVRFLERSLAIEPNAAALELLGTIYLRRGDGPKALGTLERARAVEMASSRGDPLFKVYFRAHIGRLIADAQDLQAAEQPALQAAAAEVRRACVKDWEQLLSSDRLVAERRAEAEMERGKLLYQLGEREAAIQAFQAGIEGVPEDSQSKSQGQVYADTISFLVQRGELSEAQDAYHRALGRARVVEYLKVYASLWVNDLAQRAGQPEDPLATAFLRSLRGGKWYAELARWALGQQSDEALLKRADTIGKKAEAHFYMGMRQLGPGGSARRGEELLRKVVQSDMMAFFEYEMAAHYLRRGAPAQPVLKPQPKAAPKKDPKRPAGSI